jgi:hypothetical protein
VKSSPFSLLQPFKNEYNGDGTLDEEEDDRLLPLLLLRLVPVAAMVEIDGDARFVEATVLLFIVLSLIQLDFDIRIASTTECKWTMII